MRALLVILLLASGVCAEQQVFSIGPFTGLNTAIDTSIVFNNVDLSRQGIGSISKRYGYGRASSMAGTTTDTGFTLNYVAPLNYYDGTKRLLVVYRPDEYPAGFVKVGNLHSDDVFEDSLTAVYSYTHGQGNWSMAMQRNIAYLCSDRGGGLLYDGTNVSDFPRRGPGEPKIYVMDSAGNLNGTYRYAFVVRKTPTSADSLVGMVTGEITVDSAMVALYYFPPIPADSTIDMDSVRIAVYRTSANPGSLDRGVHAYFTGLLVPPYSYGIDNVSDDSLSATDSVRLLDDRLIGRSWADSAVDTRYGAPTFMSWDGTGSTSCFTYSGDDSIMGLSYACTFIDTIMGTESSLGPTFVVWRDSVLAIDGITLGLPRYYGASGIDSNVMLNLYRAPVVSLGWDTTDLRYRDSVYYQTNDGNYWVYGKWAKVRQAADTMVAAYSLLKQLPITDTAFRDNVPIDSTESPTVPRYTPRTPPFAFRGIISHLNRIFGYRNNLLCYSQMDSLQNWSVFKFVEIDAPGDEITGIAPFRTGLRVYTNYQSFTVYGEYFSLVEKMGDWGCIAPKSLQSAENGRFYLSARGVVFESDGQTLERTVVAGLVSTKLNNFDNMDMSTKKDAVGMWLPDVGKYLLSIGDTTYVYDKRAADRLGEEVWTTWTNVDFDGGFIYGTSSSNAIMPGKTFYFWRDSSGFLYEYGASEYDWQYVVPVVSWSSGKLLQDPGWYSSLSAIGVEARTSSYIDTLAITYYGGSMYLDSLGTGYRGKDCLNYQRLYWSLDLQAGLVRNPGAWYFRGAIDRIDLFYNPRVERYRFR